MQQLRKIVLGFEVEPAVLVICYVTALYGLILMSSGTTTLIAQIVPVKSFGFLMVLSGIGQFYGVANEQRRTVMAGSVIAFVAWTMLCWATLAALGVEEGCRSVLPCLRALLEGYDTALLLAATYAGLATFCAWVLLRIWLDPLRLDRILAARSTGTDE